MVHNSRVQFIILGKSKQKFGAGNISFSQEQKEIDQSCLLTNPEVHLLELPVFYTRIAGIPHHISLKEVIESNFHHYRIGLDQWEPTRQQASRGI